ncbi:MAG TPA: hypothetical protein VGF94_15910 [Kofleriaceae bacterium]|jgi:hypothetical protein
MTATTLCGSCGAPLEGSNFLYSAQGVPSCAKCAAKVDIANTDLRAAGNIVKAGWSALGGGVLAFAAGMMFLGIITYLIVAGSIASAVFCFLGFSKDSERFSRLLTASQRTTAFACAVIGLVLCGVTVLGVPALISLHMM